MVENNICRFVPRHNDCEAIHTINFVLERKQQKYESLKMNSVYKMHLVTAGKGILHTPGCSYPLKKGDIFFVLLAVPSAIESVENFEYMYISYIGARANMIMDKLKITSQNCVFHDLDGVFDFWMDSLRADSAMFDLRSESVLLYTFSVMGTKFIQEDEGDRKAMVTASLIKKYIDDNFSNTEFSMDKMGNELSYNKKYISRVFKKEIRVSITEYLNTVRVQHACTLMEQGFTSVKDIALLCGYKDSLYFSRVFKKEMQVSPREHIAEIDKKKR